MSATTHCLRCGLACRPGTPDPKARAIVQAQKGFCPSCMIQKFLLGIEPIRDLFARGQITPHMLTNDVWRETPLRPVLRGVLAHTQLPEDSIDWHRVVRQWDLPWPAAKRDGELF